MLTILEARLCKNYGLTPHELRRQPFALLWLWLQASLQAEGFDTEWVCVATVEEVEAAVGDLRSMLACDARAEGH